MAYLKYFHLLNWKNSGMNLDQALSKKRFYFSNENITEIIKEIKYFINIISFYCNCNMIIKIPKEIKYLSKLQVFYCNNNAITELPKEIKYLTNLEILSCEHNLITNIPDELYNLKKLKIINFNNNKITKISSNISKLINLYELYFRYNKLTKLPKELSKLYNLTMINISNNKITHIPIEYMYLRKIYYFNYKNNPIEYIPPPLRRFFIYLEQHGNIQNIYNDNQNIHNHNIQEGINNCIKYLISLKPQFNNFNELEKFIFNNKKISKITKKILLEYSYNQNIHSVFQITFSELLMSVLTIINNLNDDIHCVVYNIMETELNDSVCKCFTGRLSRLVNCLNGFDDNIIINISKSEQIGNIIINIKNKLEQKNNYTIDKHKELVIKELKERNYNNEIINQWINYI